MTTLITTHIHDKCFAGRVVLSKQLDQGIYQGRLVIGIMQGRRQENDAGWIGILMAGCCLMVNR